MDMNTAQMRYDNMEPYGERDQLLDVACKEIESAWDEMMDEIKGTQLARLIDKKPWLADDIYNDLEQEIFKAYGV